MNFRYFTDANTLFETAATYISELSAKTAGERNSFHIALAGGNTPRPLYQRLAERTEIEWERWRVWFGDERCVPPDSLESNYLMARQTLLDHVPIPRSHIYPMYPDAAKRPEEAAEIYEHLLDRHAPRVRNRPQLDLILLGLGPDGHTASLFPGTPILDEKEKNVAAVFVPKLDAWRITMTIPAIENARHILFLVDSKGKADILQRLENGPAPGEELLPVERLHPHGKMQWFVTTPH